MPKFWPLFLLLTGALSAQPLDQVIEANYKRAALGVRLKYVDGILCNRTDDFRLLNPSGQQLDLAAERQRFQALLASSTRSGLKTEILEMQKPDPNRIICVVSQELLVEFYNQKAHRLEVRSVKSKSQDLWVKRPEGWKIQATQVLEQLTGPGAPLPEKYMRGRREL